MEVASIEEFYRGRSVFITGATGFMGKVLVEKLLRSCPDIGRLYLLTRPTPTKDVRCRLEELINCQIFDWLKQNRPDALEKLVPISGDVALPDLAISSTDMEELCENVSVVFHLAARVRFDDNLRSAIDSNVKGPKKVSVLCRQFKNLQAFVHVSTTFNNLDKKEIDEVVYPASLDPQKLIDLIDSMNEKLLASITKQLVGNSPNVYAYTKGLGEQLLQTECETHKIPLVIVRPSTVTPAMKEPFPGWIDTWNGPTSIVAGVLKGLIRTVRVKRNLVTDLIPVDISTNLMIASAWDIATDTSMVGLFPVYNCSSGSLNPIKWGYFEKISFSAVKKFPCKEIMWYPSIRLNSSRLVFEVELFFYHFLPGLFFDTIAVLCGKKPILTRLYKKANKIMSCLEFYTIHEWHFISRNSDKLLKKMSAQDRDTFNFDVKTINWDSYLETYVTGVRQFLHKDDMSTLPVARKNLKRMKLLRTIFRLVLVGLMLFFFYLLWNAFSTPSESLTISHSQMLQNFTSAIFSLGWNDFESVVLDCIPSYLSV